MFKKNVVLIIFALLFVFSNVCSAASLVDKGIQLLNNGDPDASFKLFKES